MGRHGGTAVDIDGTRLNTYCWIPLHGEHAKAGVEHDHFEDALRALDVAAMYRPEPREQLRQWALEGFQAFVDCQQRLFSGMLRECEELIAAEQALPPQVLSATAAQPSLIA